MLYLELGCIPYQELIQKRRLMFLYYILHEDPKSMIFKFFEAQRKNPTRKDWVTTIKNDLEELNINLQFEEIMKMKKSELRNILKQKIEIKVMKRLEKLKNMHSKVNHIKHEFLRIQNYLKSTGVQITKEERQLIFKMRCRVTDLKMNFKRKYEDHNCEACKQEEETQKHILECKEIQKKQQSIKCNLEYEKLFHGNLNDKIEIARTFKENMEIRESIREDGL